MRLVLPAKVTEILGAGHVCFGEQDHRFTGKIAQHPHQFNDGMGLRQVDGRCADFLPEKRHRVQPQDAHAVVDMQAHDPEEFQQDLGVSEIEIDLIVAKGAPDMAGAICGFHLAQQGVRAGADHLGKIVFGRGFEKERVIGRVALQVSVEPCALTADVVQDQIGHEFEF